MREFEYFLFENFDADEEADNPYNPRHFLNRNIDPVLSEMAKCPVGTYAYPACCDLYGAQLVDRLMEEGVLRFCGTGLAFDCPLFLREDAAVLYTEIASKARALTDLLQMNMTEIRSCCGRLGNGFSVEVNLYHMLCGMVFDGYFFDYLSDRGALAVSRKHPSGLDYLTVIYEKCGELRALSDGLLCSYNRFANAKCSLQSFGDAQGDRFDLYRFFRLMEQGKLPDKFKAAKRLLIDSFGGADKDAILDETVSLVRTGQCEPAAMALLEMFGYVQDGTICVPVYGSDHQKCVMEIEAIVERCIGKAMTDTLIELADSIDVTAVRHGVNPLEIANELYHIVFGSVNEELAARGLVINPKAIPEEGRYLKCVEIDA